MKKPHLPIAKLIPNLITIGAFCSGLSAVRYAMLDRWELAAALILLAAFLDGIDGRVARMLKATSNFGAQMDSLSDVVCFGVAPALVLHLWILQDVKRFGWAVALIYAVCCALRLARFNTSLMEEKEESWQKDYFTGIPAPAGAILACMPLILSLHFEEMLQSPYLVWAVMAYLPLIGLLMVSRVPTFSLKGQNIARAWVLPVMLLAVVLVIGLLVETWLTVAVICIIYLGTIPVSYLQAKHHKA